MSATKGRPRRRGPRRGARLPPHLALGDFQDAVCPFFESDTIVPRRCVCIILSRLAILRIEGCLNGTLSQSSWHPLGSTARTSRRSVAGAGRRPRESICRGQREHKGSFRGYLPEKGWGCGVFLTLASRCPRSI